MNSSRDGLLHGNRKWQRRIMQMILCAALPAVAAPLHKPASRNARVQQSDVISPDTQKTAPDLLLKKEDELKSDALAAFVDGIIAEDNGDADKAVDAYKKALSLDPSYGELAVKVAFELARRGDVSSGIEILKDSIKSAPKEPVTYLYLSQLYEKYLKKPDLAQKYAQQALDLDPRNFASYVALYEIYINTGQQKKAAELLERASQLDNDDPQFWLQLGDFYVRLLMKDDGSAAPDDLKKMNAVYEKARALANNDPDVLTRVADYYVLSRQTKDAIPLYLKVVQLKQNTSDPSFTAVQDKLARSFSANGQIDEAISVLQKLIKDNPVRYETYELLGELYEKKGDTKRALENYQQTLLLDPAVPINYLRVAQLFININEFDKAVATVKEARQKFPQVPQITYSLAIAYSKAKKNQEAVATFEEALHEAENVQQDMINGEFYFSYGAAAEQAGLIDKAVALLKKSIELDPGSAAQAYNYLGYMWVDKNQNLDEAGDLIKRAVEMEPQNPAYIDSLGWWYFKKGEPQKALEQLQKAAATIQPEDPVVYEHLGDVYEKLNNSAQALACWQKAATLGPDDKDALAQKIENAKQKLAAHSAEPQQ